MGYSAPPQNQTPARSAPIASTVVGLVGLIVVGLLFVPWAPHSSLIGLDLSWEYGLNEALAHGAVFGREVAFTFDPYAVYAGIITPQPMQ